MHERPNAAATDVAEFLTDLDGGQFDALVSVALSKTAAAVVDAGDKKKGEVTIKLKMEPIKGTHQVRIEHTVVFKHPTMHGKASEEASGATVMHVGKGGAVSLSQGELFGKPAKQTESK